MRHLGLSHGYDIDFYQQDKSSLLFLCVGNKGNRVLISGTTPFSRQAAILNAIDELGVWGARIDVWLTTEKHGKLVYTSTRRSFRTHVKPYFGRLKILDINQDADLRKTYTGIGIGRTLTGLINGRYYFRNGNALETKERYRGFDCTTFPISLFSIKNYTAHGYGLHVAILAGICKFKSERMTTNELKKRFEKNEPFDIEDGPILQDENARAVVSDSLLGSVFAISSHLIEKEVVSAVDLDLGISTGLAWPKGPFTMMNEMGMEKAARLVNTAVDKGYFKMPKKFDSGDLSPWKL